MEQNEKNGTESAIGWLIATYIFALLGGLLGIACGIIVYRDKKYKMSHRNLGLIGAVLAIISAFVWRFLFI